MALLVQERPFVLRSLIGFNPRRAVLVADLYLDHSGTHKASPLITMAGYVFAAARLEGFERQSEKLFKEFKIVPAVFHAKDFEKRRSRSPFAGWSVAKQTHFADRWLTIAKAHALRGITISLPKARYDDLRKTHKKNLNIGVYGQCLNDVLVECTHDKEIWSLTQSEGLAVILEIGNENNEGCVQFFNKARKEKGLEKEFARIGYARKEDCIAIQLADFLAYYSWQFASECWRRGDDGKTPLPSLLELAKNRVKTLGILGDGFTVLPDARQRRRGDEGG